MNAVYFTNALFIGILYRLLKWKISDDDDIQGSLVGTRYLLYSVLLLALSTFTICKKVNLSHNNYRLDKLYFNNLVFQIPICDRSGI